MVTTLGVCRSIEYKFNSWWQSDEGSRSIVLKCLGGLLRNKMFCKRCMLHKKSLCKYRILFDGCAKPSIIPLTWCCKQKVGRRLQYKACEGNHHKPSYCDWIVYETVFTVEGRERHYACMFNFPYSYIILCCVLSDSEYFEFTFDVFMGQFTW